MRFHPTAIIAALFLVSCSSAPEAYNASGGAVTAIEARLIGDDEYARLQVETVNPLHAYESVLQKPRYYFIPLVVSGSIADGDIVSIEAIDIERSEGYEPARIWLRGDLLSYWDDYDLGAKANRRIEALVRANLPLGSQLGQDRSSVGDVIIAVIDYTGGKPEAWKAVLSINGELKEFGGQIETDAPFLVAPRMF